MKGAAEGAVADSDGPDGNVRAAPLELNNCPASRLLKILGPGLVTGAANDDSSAVTTYSQAGPQFRFATLWTMLLAFPLIVPVEDACMRIGTVTGKGHAGLDPVSWTRCHLGYAASASVVETLAS